MNPQEALQYLSQVGSDLARSLPPSSQGPTVVAINQALSTLQPLVEEAMQPRPFSVGVDEGAGTPPLRAVPPVEKNPPR